MGVELHGDWMFPLAYWILADHPGDYFFGNQYNTRRTRVPVSEIIHPFLFKRMGQTRGVPRMVAAMLRLQKLGGYDEATLVKARAAAQKLGILTKEVPEYFADQFPEYAEQGAGVMDCEPGGILELPPGFKFNAWDPADPSPQYDPFTKRQTRMAAAAGGVSYTSLSNDIENVNFSSIRAGLLEEREGWKGGQKFAIAEFVRPVFEAWAPMAILSGQLDVPMSLVDAILDQEAACFQGRGWPWIDPEKDVAAELAAVDGGIKSRTKVCAERRLAFDKVTAVLGRENRMRAAEGLLPPEEPAAAQPGEDPDASDAADAAVKFLKRDGWVTINGARVHIGDDGIIDKGPAGLVEHSQRRARSARANQASEAASQAQSAAFGSHSSSAHTTAADAHRQAEVAHVEAAESGPMAPQHEAMALAHREKADAHDRLARMAADLESRASANLVAPAEDDVDEPEVLPKFSVLSKRGTATIDRATAMLKERGYTLGDSVWDGKETHYHVTNPDGSSQPRRAREITNFLRKDQASFDPPKPVTEVGGKKGPVASKPRRTFALPFAPTGSQDVLDHIVDQGGMLSRRKAVQQGHPTVAADYDDAPELRGVYHTAVFGGTIKPDRMAHILHQDHGIGDGSIGGLYSAVDDAVRTRRSVQKETARQAEAYRQSERFEKEGMTPHRGDTPIHVSNLVVGDTVVVHGEHLKVKDVDPDTLDVTLQDHSRYGAQRVSGGQVLYVEKVEEKDAGDAPF